MCEFLDKSEFELAFYIARQSILSAGSNASRWWPPGFSLSSPFQNRMVRSDWVGSAENTIRYLKTRNRFDYLLVDLFDERLGVFRLAEDHYVTRSINMAGSRLEEIASQGVYLPFGSDEHFEAWQARVRVFAYRLKKMGVLEQTILVKVPWASVTDSGDPLASSAGITPSTANRLYSRYYDVFKKYSLTTIDLTNYKVRAEPLHQWGLAPFHYTIDVYQEMRQQLIEATTVSERT